MTQVLAVITPECCYLVADRRLTYGSGARKGQVATEDECKIVSLCHVSAIAYTGLSRLSNMPTNEWIAKTLAEVNCKNAGQASETLRQTASAALPNFQNSLRRQAFLICGWTPFGSDRIIEPHIGLISNFHDDALTQAECADDEFRIRTRTLKRGELAAAFAIGEPLRAGREAALLRSVRRAAAREDGHSAVLRILAEEIFLTSACTPSVGDRVQACCIPIASANDFFKNRISRLSGLRARADRATFSYFDHEYNEYEQFAPTFACGYQAFTDIKYRRSRSGPETSVSFRILHAPAKQP